MHVEVAIPSFIEEPFTIFVALHRENWSSGLNHPHRAPHVDIFSNQSVKMVIFGIWRALYSYILYTNDHYSAFKVLLQSTVVIKKQCTAVVRIDRALH